MPHPRFFPAPLALAAALTATLAMAAWPASSHAQEAPTAPASATFDIALAAQPLGTALNALARQAKLQLLVHPDLVAGKSAPAVTGKMTARQALDRVLVGSGLSATLEGNAAVIKSLPRATNVTLAPVTVTAEAVEESATGPVYGYVAKRSATATKTDTPIVEVPQSISIVSAEQMEIQRPRTLTDALAYTAGIVLEEGNGLLKDTFNLRGFRVGGETPMFRDGLRMINFYSGRQEPYGLERIEVLKGASSLLFGNVGPGGVVNTVSKKPVAELLREVNLSVGTNHLKQASADLSGALNEDGSLSYRLTALARDSDSFVDYVYGKRSFIAPALKWQPSASTSLTVLSTYTRDRFRQDQGQPVEGTVRPNPNGSIRSNRYIGEPKHDKVERDTYTAGYIFDHAFDAGLKLEHSTRYAKSTGTTDYTFGFFTDPNQQTVVNRLGYVSPFDASGTVTDTHLTYAFNSGALSHTVLVGLDYARMKYSAVYFERTTGDLDLFNPSYGASVGSPVLQDFSEITTKATTGLYLQDQLKIHDKWVLLVGGRQTWAKQRVEPYAASAGEAIRQSDSAFSGRAGVVYLADNGLAPFASYSQSFEPEIGTDQQGNRFKPTRGEQVEVGVRYQPKGRDLMLSAAWFDIRQKNITTRDPVNFTDARQVGEVRSRGLDLEAKAQMTRQLNVIAAYGYTDAVITKSLNPNEVDGRRGGSPRNQFSLWAEYGFGDFGKDGLTVGLGGRYVGSTLDTFRATGLDGTLITVPSYTVFDAAVSYTTGRWRFAVNGSNLANKKYVNSCWSGSCFYGEGRKVVATASYRW